nr:immunoglobulin heavy chain junction region [Mus musculus]MBK4184863.1 immunoglobulin heavy chain junction region [Mus musculus]MBK4184864.1 immunoglobulin heavy chain junction region [Mus musculus]MBK4189325.1 immunoglobulin heavy chain junction region [Mus musculus]
CARNGYYDFDYW